jgi:hypothetical protein
MKASVPQKHILRRFFSSDAISTFQKFLAGWPYDADNNVRVAFGADGREVILVRLRMGLEQYELNDRPDGRRVKGEKSAFAFHAARIHAGKTAAAADHSSLGAEDCAELGDECLLYHQRLTLFARLKDWERVERDAARNLRVLDFVIRHARYEADRERFAHWRTEIVRIHAAARAMILLEQCQFHDALKIAGDTPGLTQLLANAQPDCGKLVAALRDCLREGLTSRLPPRTGDESVFQRQNDFWTIRHRGQTTWLKSTRGLHCLAFLLRHPGREFHVNELLASLRGASAAAPANVLGDGPRPGGNQLAVAGLYGGCPRLDAQAKAEYKQRLNELRQELNEAEQFNDLDRAAKVQEEMNAIAQQLASAMGLGGRDRKTSSEAERARCAVTKRIKQSIQKISEANPDLGRHLAVSVKTGYFCSYTPQPERPVAWNFNGASPGCAGL